MKQAAEIDRDIFYAPGVYRVLRSMLASAETDADYRAVLREIGRDLAERGDWRARIKLAAGWDGHKSAWAALAAYIEANRTEQPWWAILEYADGGKVSAEVRAFFTEKA